MESKIVLLDEHAAHSCLLPGTLSAVAQQTEA